MSLTPGTPDLSGMTGSKKGLKIGEQTFGWGLVAVVAAGVFGVAALALGGVAELFAGIAGLMTLALSGLWSTVAFVASLAVIWFIVTDHAVHNALMNIRRGLYRKIVAGDPIGILRNTVSIMKKKMTEFDAAITQVSASKQRITAELDDYAAQIRDAKNKTMAALKMRTALNNQLPSLTGNDLMEARLRLQELDFSIQGFKESAGTNIESIKQEQPLLEVTSKMYENLCQLRNLASFKIRSLSSKADQLDTRHKSMEAGAQALGAGSRILKGDQKQDELWDMAVQNLNDEAANVLGAMNDFTRWSQKAITDMTIQQAAGGEEADALFAKMESAFQVPGVTQAPVVTANQIAPPVDSSLEDMSIFQLPSSVPIERGK